MGYTTDFNGVFTLNKVLDKKTHKFLNSLNKTRRMARHLPKEYGVEGEFYVDDNWPDSIIDHNTPPSTQPGLWCGWRPTDDGTGIEWDGGEKFYNYVEWIEYIVVNILAPRGYALDGAVQWRGENFDDIGTIIVKHNGVSAKSGKLLTMKVKKPTVKKPKQTTGKTYQATITIEVNASNETEARKLAAGYVKNLIEDGSIDVAIKEFS